MADVTSGLLSENTAARYQLTDELFPVIKSAARDDVNGGDCVKTGASWKSSDTEDGRSHSGDISTTTRWNGTDDRRAATDGAGRGCWAGGPPGQPGAGSVDDVGGLQRLAAADSAVGRLVMMIQRLTDTANQRQLPAASHLHQATPPRPPMTSSSDVTSSHDLCHVRTPVGKSAINYS